MGKGVSRIEDGIPGEKSHAAVIAALVSVFCRDFRSSRSGMLKLRRIWIAIDFHGSDGAGWHVEFSALDTINKDRKSTRLNSSHRCISYAVFCLKKKKKKNKIMC